MFEAGGSSLEFAILADLDDLIRAAQRDELSSFTLNTLRAIGFSGTSILASFLPEAVLLGAAGGVLGVALGWLVNGARVNVMTASIRFTVTPAVAAAGLLLSIAVGILGGLPPALRATRLRVVQAIKHV